MAQEGWQDEHDDHHREMLLTVAVVVFQMVDTILEYGVSLVLDLPATRERTDCSITGPSVAKALR